MISISILETLFLVVGTAGFLYWIVLALTVRLKRPRSSFPVEAGDVSVIVLIPAHNEARCLGNLLADLDHQEVRPSAVLVVADRCTDDTEAVAGKGGARVLVLSEGGGAKGEALAAGIDHIREWSWDVVLILDADCRVEPDFMKRSRVTSDGVWQAQVELRSEDGIDSMYPFWSRLENAVFHRGRSLLGLPAFLRGTGMLLGRKALDRCPWRAGGLTEDRAQGLAFLRAGIFVRYRTELSVFSEPPAGLGEGWRQRRRWSSAGLLRPILESLRTAWGTRSWMGLRALELPLATLADARSLWLLLVVLAAGLGLVAGSTPWPALILLLVLGSLVTLIGFSWYGWRFSKVLARVPTTAVVALGSAALALFGHSPRKWGRSKP